MAMRRERMRLGDLLIKQDVLTEENLKKALELQKGTDKKIGEVLVENGFITEEMIARALQTQLGLKIIQLTGITIPKEVRNLVSVNLLKKYQCIPFELDPYNANNLHLAMADPMDMAAIDDISIVTNLQVEPYIATPRDILTAIDHCYGASETMDAARRFTREREQLRGNAEDTIEEADVSDAPIVQLVRSLIEQAVRQRASDIHIEALESKVRVRYRIDGALYEKMVYDSSLLPAISTRIKIMGGMDISEKRKPQDGRMSVMVDRREYDIRISSIPTVHGEKIVMRISSKLNLTRDIKELGLNLDEMSMLQHMLAKPYGILFVTGPTGSGKSTLLNMIGGLDIPTSGSVLVKGKKIGQLNEEELTVFRRRNIGFVFQNYNLIPTLNVYENIVFPVELDGNDIDKDFLNKIVTILGIDKKLENLPGNLSGGQQQRVAIARALITKPAIILADEPTGNLDTQSSLEVMGLLKQTSERFCQTIVMITHNMNLAQMTDRIIRIQDGKIIDA